MNINNVTLDDEFLYNYQSHHFKEDSEDPFVAANAKRKCLSLALAFSKLKHNNQTTCHLLEDKLNSYAELVDNRTGINNFAKATLELLKGVKNVSKTWKSSLPESDPPLKELLPPLKGECLARLEEGQCGNGVPSSLEIQSLLGRPDLPSPLPRKSPLCVVQSDRESRRAAAEQSHQQAALEKVVSKPSLDFKRKKTSLYSSYTEKMTAESSVSYEDSQDEEVMKMFPKTGIYNQLPGGKGYYKKNKPLFGGYNKSWRKRGEESGQDEEMDGHTMQEPAPKVQFKTAGQQLHIENQKKYQNNGRMDQDRQTTSFQPHVAIKKSLGGKRNVSSKFVPPVRNNTQEEEYNSRQAYKDSDGDPESELDSRLKNIEPRMIELIKSEIMDTDSTVTWDDIAGLQFAKATIQEIVVWPMLRPDIFTGLRRPPKGILLFGPPGTGKTLIGKCIASQSKSTFFSISASSLTSKWIGDGEKMVRALFAVARCQQPSVVFIDEIDSLLSQRSDTEHESSRRIKTEFLVQLDGAATGEEDRILVIGATNRPQELDEAARRRLVKRLYIPLPDMEARKQLVENLMKCERNELTSEETSEISQLTDGYSGADMKNLCQEASLGPIRSLPPSSMFQISPDQVRPVNMDDFKSALRRVKSSVSSKDLEIYLKWDHQYGSGGVSF